MVDLISYPFRLDANGHVVTLPDGIDYYGDELAMLVQTMPGERELVPLYGIKDPTFARFNKVELIEKISLFGPPVDIAGTKSTNYTDGRVIVNIRFTEAVQDTEISRLEDNQDNYYEEEYDESNPLYNFGTATDF